MVKALYFILTCEVCRLEAGFRCGDGMAFIECMID